MSSSNEQHRRLELVELDDVAEAGGTVFVPVQIRRITSEGVMVRCGAPSGLLQYFWIDASQLRRDVA